MTSVDCLGAGSGVPVAFMTIDPCVEEACSRLVFGWAAAPIAIEFVPIYCPAP